MLNREKAVDTSSSAGAIDRLIRERPNLHAGAGGIPVSWAVPPEVLRFIFENISPGMVTLETGSGHTTVAFAIAGARHTAISPAADEFHRITEYCRSIGVEPTVAFLAASSDEVLPSDRSLPAELDFVFIDGAHQFPLPCLDYHYAAPRLKVGGILGVDDVAMPSVKLLYDFLLAEGQWQLVCRIKDTAFFRRVRAADRRPGDYWASQGINRRFYRRQLRRQRSRLRWLAGATRRFLKDPGRYLGRLTRSQGHVTNRDVT